MNVARSFGCDEVVGNCCRLEKTSCVANWGVVELFVQLQPGTCWLMVDLCSTCVGYFVLRVAKRAFLYLKMNDRETETKAKNWCNTSVCMILMRPILNHTGKREM